MEAIHHRLNGAERIPIEQAASCAAVRAEHVDHFWPKVGEWIQQALHEAVHHELTAHEIYKRCKSGECLMLLIALGEQLKGVAVLEKSVNAKGNQYVCIIAAGGDRMPEWIGELVATCRRICLECGAVELMMIGRPGWRPYLQAQGARVKCICMSMEVLP